MTTQSPSKAAPPSADPFAIALRRAVSGVGADGRILASDARALRAALRGPSVGKSGLLAEPESVLGEFESLPAASRRAIVNAVVRDGRGRMAGYEMGRAHVWLARKLWAAESRIRFGRFVRPSTELLATLVQVAPAWGVHALLRRGLAWPAKVARRPRLENVLAAAGVETRNLAVCYASGIPQLPAYRGFWHDPALHSTVGLVVGLDFIQNDEGYWFIEANMDCGLLPERTALYRDDPFVHSLLDVAAKGGYRELAVLAGSSSIEPAMARQFRAGAGPRRLAVRLIEDAFHPRFGHTQGVRVPDTEGGGLLVVRSRHYRTNVDFVVQHKRASARALRLYLDETGDESFRLPATTAEPVVPRVDLADPFPNLVFKYPERDKGEGVFFLKVASPSEARDALSQTLELAPSGGMLQRIYSRLDDGEGVFQPYIRTPMLPDRRLYRTRAHVLLTPVGVHFLSAHRIVCSKPVPQELPPGVVSDQEPYVVSYHGDARFALVPPDEERAVARAALGVARGLARALSRGFDAGPVAAGPAEAAGAGERRQTAATKSR